MTVTATADSTTVPDGSFGKMQTAPLQHAPSAWLAWTMLPLGFGGGMTTLMFSRKRRQRWMRMLMLRSRCS